MKAINQRFTLTVLRCLLLLCAHTLHAQVPHYIGHEAQLTGANATFTGATGKFKFALVDTATSMAYWNNSDTAGALAANGQPVAEPSTAFTLSVASGAYAVYLGSGMPWINYSVFGHAGLRVRTWFSPTGAAGSFVLQPDTPIPAVAYAMQIPDGTITTAKLASGAVTGSNVGLGAVSVGKLLTVASPTTGQVLSFNGTGMSWVTPGGGIWALNGTNAFYNGGNVGIGIGNPGFKLTVNAGSNAFGIAQTDGTATVATLVGNNSSGTLGGWLGTQTNHPLFLFANVGEPKMTILPNGKVGIGVLNPGFRLTVNAGPNAFGIAQTDGTATVATLVGNNSSGALGGWLGTQTNHPLFLFANVGEPKMTLLPNGNVGIGTLNPSRTLEVAGDFYARDASIRVLTIRGADVAEPFDIAERDLSKGTVVVIDEKRHGGLKRSTVRYDTCVAGIVSGANGVDSGIILSQPGVNEGGQNVAISGRVYVHADASSGPISPGDLLTTSDTPGHAMKVVDHARAQGAVIGKAMSSLEEGTGMVLVLVTLQ